MQGWALCIGIDKYADPQIPDLRFAANDALAVGAFFSQLTPLFHPDRVRTLRDEAATTKEIRTEIGRLERKVRPEDFVLLYFACHGGTEPPSDLPEFDGYLIPHDASKDFLGETAYSMRRDLQRALARLKNQATLVVVDACFSGRANQHVRTLAPLLGARVLPTHSQIESLVRSIVQGKGIIVFTACDADEVALEDETLKQGIFTFEFLSVLRDKLASPPYRAELSAIFGDLHERTSNRSNGAQRPTYFGELTSPMVLTTGTELLSDPALVKRGDRVHLRDLVMRGLLQRIATKLDSQASYEWQADPLVTETGLADIDAAAVTAAFTWHILVNPAYAIAELGRAFYLFVVDTGGGRHEQLQARLAETPGRIGYYHVYGRDDAILLLCSTPADATAFEDNLAEAQFRYDKYAVDHIARLFGVEVVPRVGSGKLPESVLKAIASPMAGLEYESHLQAYVNDRTISGRTVLEDWTRTQRLRAFCAVKLVNRRQVATSRREVFEALRTEPRISAHIASAFLVQGNGDADMFFELRASSNAELDQVTDVIANLSPGRRVVESWSFVVAKSEEAPAAVVSEPTRREAAALWSGLLGEQLALYEQRYTQTLRDEEDADRYTRLDIETRMHLVRLWMASEGAAEPFGDTFAGLAKHVDDGATCFTRAVVRADGVELKRTITHLAPAVDYVMKTGAWRLVEKHFEGKGETARANLHLGTDNIGRLTIGQSIEFFTKWREFAEKRKIKGGVLRTTTLTELGQFNMMRNALVHPDPTAVTEDVAHQDIIVAVRDATLAALEAMRIISNEVIIPTGGFARGEGSAGESGG